MKTLLLLCLGLLLAAPAARAQASAAPPAAASTADAESSFLAVANAAAELMQRLMAQPATPAAEAPLLREGAALCQRGRAVTPAYAQWLRSRSRPELQAAVRHLQASPFVRYLGPLPQNGQFVARYPRSPAAAGLLLELFNALDFERY